MIWIPTSWLLQQPWDDNSNKSANMSMDNPQLSKPTDIHDQDVSLFSQYLLSTSTVNPNQERGILPSSLGEGLRISTFASWNREFDRTLISDESIAQSYLPVKAWEAAFKAHKCCLKATTNTNTNTITISLTFAHGYSARRCGWLLEVLTSSTVQCCL